VQVGDTRTLDMLLTATRRHLTIVSDVADSGGSGLTSADHRLFALGHSRL